MITRQRLAEIADELSEGFRGNDPDTIWTAVSNAVDELRSASGEPRTRPLCAEVEPRDLPDYVGYRFRMIDPITEGSDRRSILVTIASVRLIDGRNAQVELVEWPGHHVTRSVPTALIAPQVRKPFVPAAHYAPGVAVMLDAIEQLEIKLATIELALDAHRAALVAAGWLDVNGNVTVRDDQR